jgi:hypothetical protein
LAPRSGRTAEILTSAVTIFNLDRPSADRFFRIICPFCLERTGSPDTKGHLHFFLDNNWSICYRCDARASVERLFVKLKLERPLDVFSEAEEIADAFFALRRRFREAFRPLEETLTVPYPPEIELPDGALPLSRFPRDFAGTARIWAVAEKNWGFKPETILELDWHYWPKRKAFVFPARMDGRLVFWSSRGATARIHLSAPTDFAAYGIVGNWDDPLREENEKVYLVEGPRDAAAMHEIGEWAVYLFGHKLSKAAEARLSFLPHEKIFLLDADVANVARTEALRTGWKAIFLPKGDPNDIRREALLDFLKPPENELQSYFRARLSRRL